MTSTHDLPGSTIQRIVEQATRAPSVHNTQPWRWRATGNVLELSADRRFQLRETDPAGRNLVISCGTALHHARVAADAMGWASHVTRHPDPSRPDLLARLALSRSTPGPGSAEMLDAIGNRCTDRRRFTSWPVPEERLSSLARAANGGGTRAIALTDTSERFRAERLIDRAGLLQRSMPMAMAEQRAWRDRGTTDGIPSSVVPAYSTPPPAHRPRFGGGFLDDTGEREVEGSDGLIVVFHTSDDETSWLRAGEGLSALWLDATREGMSIVPLSQVTEVAETRQAFQLEVLGGLAYPLVVIRVGWQPISRGELPRTPRRPVAQVLEVA